MATTLRNRAMVNHIENFGIGASGMLAVALEFADALDPTGLGRFSEYGQMTALAVCLALLAWKIMRRDPQVEKEHAKVINTLTARHQEVVKEICDTQKECNAEICAKIEENMEAVQLANHEHLTLLRTHFLKIDVS